ncbi:MAG: ABC transporter permease [Chloroflexota bacterium]|nr:ABC transporter permease [Chloroflexota bacterium]
MSASPAVRIFEHQALVYRRVWRGTLFISFITPTLFLAAMGLGLGAIVDANNPAGVQGVSYLAFLGPGLLVASAMQTAAFECTFPVMAGIVWLRTYEAMLATPAGVRDILLGHLAWVAVRLTMVAGVFVAVMFLFGAVTTPLAVLALLPAVLTGFAFAAPITAFAATQKNDSGFSVLFRFGITPLFIFSGTFFPISQLPELLQPIAYLTPLYHGVAVSRGLALGTLDPLAIVLHLAVLIAFIVAGFAGAMWTFRRRLVR